MHASLIPRPYSQLFDLHIAYTKKIREPVSCYSYMQELKTYWVYLFNPLVFVSASKIYMKLPTAIFRKKLYIAQGSHIGNLPKSV